MTMHLGMTDLEYDQIDAVRQSTLSKWCGGYTPEHARYQSAYQTTTKAMKFGSAFDAMILGGPAKVVQLMEGPFKSDFMKAEKAAFMAEHEFDYVVDKKEWPQLQAMKASLLNRQNSAARELMTCQGQNQVVFVWDDKDSGLKLKSKLDRLVVRNSAMAVVDLKTAAATMGTPGGSREAFGKSIANYGYHRQGAMYLDAVASEFGPGHRDFFFVVAEKEPPFLWAVHLLSDDDVEQGREELAEAKARYAECIKDGYYPGYGDEAMITELPGWSKKK